MTKTKFKLPEKEVVTSQDAIDAAEALQKYLEEVKNFAYRQVIAAKVDANDIENAEERLKIKLPASYKEFVVRFGLFEIMGEYGQSYNQMLAPEKLTRLTPAMIGKGAEADRLEKLIRFQNDPYPDNYFVFDTANVRDGEISIRRVHYDEDFDESNKFVTFPEHMYYLCQKKGEMLDKLLAK